jgi:hypothetical protein
VGLELRHLSRLLMGAVDDDGGPKRAPRQCLQLTRKLQPTQLVRSAVRAAEDTLVAVPAGSGGAGGAWKTPAAPVRLDEYSS